MVGGWREEHASDVLCPLVEGNFQQLGGAFEVLLLRQLRPALEHDVKTLTCRPLHHQQSKLFLLRQHLLRRGLHPLSIVRVSRLEVNVHGHRACCLLCPFQCAVLVGQTGVVHLHHVALPGCAVLLRVAQGAVLLLGADRAHPFRPVHCVDYVYTHALSPILLSCIFALAFRVVPSLRCDWQRATAAFCASSKRVLATSQLAIPSSA